MNHGFISPAQWLLTHHIHYFLQSICATTLVPDLAVENTVVVLDAVVYGNG